MHLSRNASTLVVCACSASFLPVVCERLADAAIGPGLEVEIDELAQHLHPAMDDALQALSEPVKELPRRLAARSDAFLGV
eukprot:5252038-Pleurochrysis_carterae.AAC.1